MSKMAHNPVPKSKVVSPPPPKSSIEKAWEEFKIDDTQYELSDRSNDSDSDVDENYDSIYFSEAEMENNMNPKGSPAGIRLLTRKKKPIAKWAEDKSLINAILAHQQKTLNPDAIFGRLSVDTVNLAEIFGQKCSYPDFRGSSANWKNENWTPLPSERPQRRLEGEDTACAENLDRKFVLSQTCGALEEALAGEEVDSGEECDAGSSYDFLRLQLPPSWQDGSHFGVAGGAGGATTANTNANGNSKTNKQA